MQTTKFGHLLNLLRIQIIPIAILMLTSTTVDAQKVKGSYNFLDFQQKPYYFGITLGFNNSDFNIFYSRRFILNDSIASAESVTGPGFNLGIVTNLKDRAVFRFSLFCLPFRLLKEILVTLSPVEDGARPYHTESRICIC